MTIISGTIIYAALGLLIGSFINAVVWRIHEHKSIVNDRSECTHCHHKLGFFDLIPVFSWLFLGGKCRYCRKPISVQYPVVELITASLFAVSFVQLDPAGWRAWLGFVVWLWVLGSLILVSVYDLRWMLLPDVVVLPAIAVALVPIVTNLATHQPREVWLGPLLAALVVGSGFYALAAMSDGRWMGGGDIKLVALIGLALGLQLTAVAMLIAFNVAAIVSLTLIAVRLRKRTDHIPFGPFLALGCIVALLFGHQLIGWYSGLVG